MLTARVPDFRGRRGRAKSSWLWEIAVGRLIATDRAGSGRQPGRSAAAMLGEAGHRSNQKKAIAAEVISICRFASHFSVPGSAERPDRSAAHGLSQYQLALSQFLDSRLQQPSSRNPRRVVFIDRFESHCWRCGPSLKRMHRHQDGRGQVAEDVVIVTPFGIGLAARCKSPPSKHRSSRRRYRVTTLQGLRSPARRFGRGGAVAGAGGGRVR